MREKHGHHLVCRASLGGPWTVDWTVDTAWQTPFRHGFSGGQGPIVGFFWTFRKKTQAQKTQNSSKILKKLRQNFEKTQKPATPIELSWC